MNPYIIFFAAILTNNIALTYFLGMCPFIAVSKDIKTAYGMGMAVIFVMSLTALFAWPVYHYLLVPHNLQYLQLVIFIVIIAALVQIVEMVIERFTPTLYINMGVFLPLITVNCAILGLALFMILRDYSFIQSMAYAIGSGIGWLVVIMAMAGIRTKLQFAKVPKALEGPGITMIVAGLMALGFMGFAGIVNLQ